MLIEREGGFLPPSHFPRCSVTSASSEVFDSLLLTGSVRENPAEWFVFLVLYFFNAMKGRSLMAEAERLILPASWGDGRGK